MEGATVEQVGFGSFSVRFGSSHAGDATSPPPASAPDGYAAEVWAQSTDGKPGFGSDVEVTTTVRRALEPGHTYWLVAVRDNIGNPPHRVYYNREPLDGTPGTPLSFNIAFGSEIGSERDLVVVDADRTASVAMRQSFARPEPRYDGTRVALPPGARVVSKPVPVRLTR